MYEIGEYEAIRGADERGNIAVHPGCRISDRG